MRLLMSPSVAQRLTKVLHQRGVTETGGILMGEHISPDEFRIVNFTVQRSKGTFASFLRMPRMHLRQLERFFKKTERDYRKYNYLGEWHSHPSFSICPSSPDIRAMQALIDGSDICHFVDRAP
jgi:proteasome lid subunit RPN8/RPN11